MVVHDPITLAHLIGSPDLALVIRTPDPEVTASRVCAEYELRGWVSVLPGMTVDQETMHACRSATHIVARTLMLVTLRTQAASASSISHRIGYIP